MKPDPKKGGIWAFITKRILSFGMVLVVAFLLLVSFVLTTVIDEMIALLAAAGRTDPALAIGNRAQQPGRICRRDAALRRDV